MSTVTVTANVEPGFWPPRVRLDVTATGLPAVTSTTVTRLDPDGTVSPVRTPDGNPLTLSSGYGLVYDYEAPYQAPVSYSTTASPSFVSSEVTIPEARVWLIHPGVPALSMPVTIASFADRARRAQRAVFYPMGRANPVVFTDGSRKGVESAVELRTDTLEELAALEAITADSSVLLFNIPAGLKWGVPTCYISVGDIGEARLVDYAGEPKRYVTLPYQVVDRPVGGSQAQRTLADLLVYPTLADLQAAYPTLADLLAGP